MREYRLGRGHRRAAPQLTRLRGFAVEASVERQHFNALRKVGLKRPLFGCLPAPVRQGGTAWRRKWRDLAMKKRTLKALAGLGFGALMLLDGAPAGFAAPLTPVDLGLSKDSGIVDVAVACGRRGCAAARPRYPAAHYPVRRPVHGAVVVRPGARWVRPYRWGPGGAIAAGAAIGFVAAATAAAWAPPPPQPGLCWYYTDPSQRQGFWDVCP